MGRLIFFLFFVFFGYVVMRIIGPLVGPENVFALMMTCICILGVLLLRYIVRVVRKDYEDYKRNNRR